MYIDASRALIGALQEAADGISASVVDYFTNAGFVVLRAKTCLFSKANICFDCDA